ncbi:MAG: hypothetical protein FD153_139 [Rhodospirillaceae bacterium]|nr:MAG: hypothetical protein FD153_139 [Rhodospirillaceae bacterium]
MAERLSGRCQATTCATVTRSPWRHWNSKALIHIKRRGMVCTTGDTGPDGLLGRNRDSGFGKETIRQRDIDSVKA